MKKSEMLTELNAAIQKVADESGSRLIKDLMMVEELDPKNKGDYIFMGVVDLWAGYYACGMEVESNTEPNDNRLHNLVKVRIQDALFAIIDLAQFELKKLGVKTEVTH